MKKREFLARSGVGLLGAAPLLAQARTQPAEAASSRAGTNGSAHGGGALGPSDALRQWQSRCGQSFEAHTALGRKTQLVVVSVQATRTGLAQPPSGTSQFRVEFAGPRHLPLAEGLHVLRHASEGDVALHLQPVRTADGLRYLAHFNLLA